MTTSNASKVTPAQGPQETLDPAKNGLGVKNPLCCHRAALSRGGIKASNSSFSNFRSALPRVPKCEQNAVELFATPRQPFRWFQFKVLKPKLIKSFEVNSECFKWRSACWWIGRKGKKGEGS